MSRAASGPWLFFLFNLPGTRASERVKVWRRLKKFGAIQLKTSAYVLPDEPTHYERFQWLGKEVVDVGGEATLARWLSAGQMLDGLGLAETTPGPLIIVTQFDHSSAKRASKIYRFWLIHTWPGLLGQF
jgi:hypothetical protein